MPERCVCAGGEGALLEHANMRDIFKPLLWLSPPRLPLAYSYKP